MRILVLGKPNRVGKTAGRYTLDNLCKRDALVVAGRGWLVLVDAGWLVLVGASFWDIRRDAAEVDTTYGQEWVDDQANKGYVVHF